MIEVTARLERGIVYFAGETIKCILTFHNRSNAIEENSPKKTNSVKGDTVAWASAQIHCFCNVSETRVILPESFRSKVASFQGTTAHGSTSLLPYKEEHGHCVLHTKLKILLCDLKLGPDERKEFCFSEVIPSDACPSYRGPSVKYSYKITFSTQRVGAPIKVLRIPFRVLVLYGLTDFKVEEEPHPLNPFLPPPKPTSLLDIASEVLGTITSRRSKHDYKIANSNGSIAIFTLMKGSVRLGEDIVGIFDFTIGTVSCMQFTVCLQSEEVLTEECQRRLDQGNAVVSYEKHMQHCLFLKKTHIALPVPLYVTPAFLTELVCLKWRLHFDFIVTKEPIKMTDLDTTNPGDRMWQGPSQLATETMSWDLPIRILPTMPLQAETGSGAVTCYKALF